jgi:hypothetical protein
MVTDDHCPLGGRPEVAAWLLGCMEPDEGLRFGSHLLSCRTCQLAAAELEPAAELLLGSAPPAPPAGSWLPVSALPPGGLRGRTLARVRRAAQAE